MQFWSEIILVISNRTRAARSFDFEITRMISDQIALHSVQLLLLTPLQSNYTALNEVNNWFYTFLWNGKGDKVKRKVMINDYCDGGLKMIDLFSFNKSLKSTWIKKYLDTNNNGKWKLFLDDVLKNCGGENILTSNLNIRDTLEITKVSNAFFQRNTRNLGRN